MTTTIILFRHGEVENPQNLIYGRTIPVQLSPTGVIQMENLGRYLCRLQIEPDHVYSSPIQRAVDSAKLVLQAFNNPPEIILETDLQDVDHSGVSDKTIDWLNSGGSDLYNMPQFKGKVEDQEQMARRINEVLERILRAHSGKVIFVSSHGDPLAYAMWRLKFPQEPFPKRAEMVKVNYLGKGQAWQAIFEKAGKLASCTLLVPAS